MLLGIVAKNSILLIDFAIEEMERGESKLEAIIEAGHKRAQPIVMTTVAMTAGMVPTALSLSGDARLACADGHRGDRRADPVDPADPADRARRLQPGRRLEKRVGPWLRRDLLTYRAGRRSAAGSRDREADPRRVIAAGDHDWRRATVPACRPILLPADRARVMRCSPPALLVAMAAFVRCRAQFTGVHPAWGYALAFAEAAMVGGLADWFAVTALFRHPLGLPIPHTAIIPENKDRIADTMAEFLRAISSPPRWSRGGCSGMNVALAAGNFLAEPGRRRANRASAPGAAELFAEVLESLDPERLGGRSRPGSKSAAGQAGDRAAARPDDRGGDRRQAPPAADRKRCCAGRA